MLTGFLMQVGYSQTLPEQLTADNVMSFVRANSIESAADLIESLPPLHKRHVSLVFASQALNKELVSKTHPRVVSWGADARFIFSWASNPEAPDNIEFLQHGAERWDAGVIDFSGEEPELSNPEVCSTCHGQMKRPIWGDYDFWRGTSDDKDLEQSEWLQILSDLEASDNPRISPLELSEKRVYPLVVTSSATGVMDSFVRFADEFGSMLSLRHAQVLFNRLKKRDDYAELAEQVVCGEIHRVTRLFPLEDHYLAAMHDEDRLIVVQQDSDDIGQIHDQRFFSSGNANVEASLRILFLHDIWSRDRRVSDFYARLGNEHVSPRFVIHLNYLPGTATAEQELRASYDQHFELIGQASLDARIDREKGRFHKSAVFGEGHLVFMAPRVCNIVRQAPNQQLSQLRIADGKAGEDAGEIAFAVTLDPVRSEPVSVEWFTYYTVPLSHISLQLADPGVDYPYSRGSLTFNAGEARRNVTVEIIDDDIAEPPEYFSVHLGRASGNALVVDGVALATINGELPPVKASGPTARFENAPLAHDGSAAFTVQLQFSEEVALNGAAFTNGLLTIVGGAVGQASRVTAGSNMAWEFPVTPDGDGDVVITLPALKDGACDEQRTVCTSDGRRLLQATTITVRAPVAPEITSASTFTIIEGETAVATLTARDSDSAAADLAWSLSGGADQAKFSITSAGVLSFAAAKDFENPDDADTDGSYQVTLQVNDGGRTDTADITVALSNRNEAPAAAAGVDQVYFEQGVTVTLSGSGSDPDADDMLSYAWTQTGGPSVSLSNPNTATASFDAPAGLPVAAILTFALKVTDPAGLYHEDSVSITIAGHGPLPTLPSIAAVTSPVTAAHGQTEQLNDVAVTRAEPQLAWGERLPDRDIELPSGSNPTGLWSDGETLWVISDWSTGEVTTYSLADGSALGAGQVTLSNGTSAIHRFQLQEEGGSPAGLWSNGETLWVADVLAGKVFAYWLSDGERQSEEDIPYAVLAAAGNTAPTGLWSDGTTLWVTDILAGKVFAYRLSDKMRVPEKEFILWAADGRTLQLPWGLWSDGETALVTLNQQGGVEGYALSGGEHKADRALGSVATGQSPMGLWSDHETLWVVNAQDRWMRTYAVPGLQPAPAPDALSMADPFRVRVVTRVDAAPGGVDAGPPVFIADAALHSAIAEALGLGPDGPVGMNAMAGIRALNVGGAGIADLTGLEFAVNLQALDLGHNPVTDLWTLGLLPRLTVLNLDEAGTDLSSLAGLVAMERLSLRNNGLTDVSALAGLVNLRHLSLRGNAVSNGWPLAGLAQLEILDLRGNNLSDRAPLSGLVNLRHLDLSDNPADVGAVPTLDWNLAVPNVDKRQRE